VGAVRAARKQVVRIADVTAAYSMSVFWREVLGFVEDPS